MDEMDEEPNLDHQLQEVIDLVHSDHMGDILQLGTHSSSMEGVNVNGDETIVDEANEFLSLPNKDFKTREDLVEAVRQIGFTKGYVLVIKQSRTNSYVMLGCDRGGKYRDRRGKNREIQPNLKKKKSSSRLIDCPFKIMGKRKSELVWKVEIKTLVHNHESSVDLSGHPFCRRFTEEEVLQVKHMSKAGIQPHQILALIRENNPRCLAVSRNVYSKTAQFRKESLAGRSIIQALLEELGGAGFRHNVKYDQNGCLTHLFLAHPISIELTKSYPNVFVMDCTYKTNRYKMPLLDIIGVSSFNTSFFSCFVFMQKEEVEDYVWALSMFSDLLGHENYPLVIVTDRELALMNAIKIVFPRTSNLLCVWHINMNVAAHCKDQFKEQTYWEAFESRWTILIQSRDVSTFNDAWNSLEADYKEYAVVLAYIKDTWLIWKEKFIVAWTGQVPHFGNQATSRAEGAHGTLKKYLQVSSGGLQEVKDKICHAIRHQFFEIRTKLSGEKIRIPHVLAIPFFRQLITNVSHYALYELHKQYVSANNKEKLTKCTGNFFRTMGLPCFHMIREMNCEVLPLREIHKQWRIDTTNFSIAISNLSNEDHGSLNHGDQFSGLLSDLKEKYEQIFAHCTKRKYYEADL